MYTDSIGVHPLLMEGSLTSKNPPPTLNTLSSVSVRESRIQYLCDPQWFRDTASRGPTTIVAPESQFRTCPSDHDTSLRLGRPLEEPAHPPLVGARVPLDEAPRDPRTEHCSINPTYVIKGESNQEALAELGILERGLATCSGIARAPAFPRIEHQRYGEEFITRGGDPSSGNSPRTPTRRAGESSLDTSFLL
ncbi:hypothetical protein F511_29878 [Dorcoceras hygrometricum]|uniref:Uncharacterized protein n=1 Tax=Dorcoceras hygrometricum TaxID=472368 RepID=A0A2Z7BYR6_9LAMI|nr:hypothetical protein F511_29878 [Dorcoceras hygrometricum]